MSLARSPITCWASDNAESFLEKQNLYKYLEKGIKLTEDILERVDGLKKFMSMEKDLTPTLFLEDNLDEQFKLKGEMEGLLEAYVYFYRDPVFKPIEKFKAGRRVQPTIDAEDAASILDPGKFEENMRNARKVLQDNPLEMIEVARKFTRPGENFNIKGMKLSNLLNAIEKDFKKDIF